MEILKAVMTAILSIAVEKVISVMLYALTIYVIFLIVGVGYDNNNIWFSLLQELKRIKDPC